MGVVRIFLFLLLYVYTVACLHLGTNFERQAAALDKCSSV